MLILASTIMLVVEFRSHLIQQLRQPTVWSRHHTAVRIVHRDVMSNGPRPVRRGRDAVLFDGSVPLDRKEDLFNLDLKRILPQSDC